MDRATLSHDTSRHVEDIQVELWRKMSPLAKARAVSALSSSVIQLSIAGLRQRFPGATDLECRLRLARLILGHELARRVYPDTVGLSGF
jgi:hypothetical protein